jgi:hypothetical protein
MIELYKKRSLHFVIILLACSCSAKKLLVSNPLLASGITIKITGTTAKINGATVSIISGDKYNKKIFWADTIKGDRFDATVNVPDPGFYEIMFAGKYPPDSVAQGWLHWVDLYLEDNCLYTVKAGADWNILHNHSRVYSSSIVQKKLSLFDESYADKISIQEKDIARKYEEADFLNKTHQDKQYQELSANILKEEAYLKQFHSKYLQEFALNNPGTIVSAHKLLGLTPTEIKEKYNQYIKIYNRMADDIKKQPDGVTFKNELDAVMAPAQKL